VDPVRAVVQNLNLYYNGHMKTGTPANMTVQARLDPESREALVSLASRLGISHSEVVRASLRSMAKQELPVRTVKLVGIGAFDSGVEDLATNKKYMEGFGFTRAQRAELERSRKTG